MATASPRIGVEDGRNRNELAILNTVVVAAIPRASETTVARRISGSLIRPRTPSFTSFQTSNMVSPRLKMSVGMRGLGRHRGETRESGSLPFRSRRERRQRKPGRTERQT
jgi:hypothetical protein